MVSMAGSDPAGGVNGGKGGEMGVEQMRGGEDTAWTSTCVVEERLTRSS